MLWEKRLRVSPDPSAYASVQSAGRATAKSFRLGGPTQQPDVPSLELLASFPYPVDCIEGIWRRDNVFFFLFLPISLLMFISLVISFFVFLYFPFGGIFFKGASRF